MPTASTKATKICTRTNVERVIQPASPAPMIAARARAGNRRTIQVHMLRPSIRMKSVMKSAMRAPASTWPAVDPTDRAPVSTAPPSAWNAFTRPSTYPVMSFSLRFSGGAARNCTKSSYRTCVVSTRSGSPRRTVITIAVMSPAITMRSPTSHTATASAFGHPLRCSQLQRGTSRAESRMATNTGTATSRSRTTMNPTRAITAATTRILHDHAAAILIPGATEPVTSASVMAGTVFSLERIAMATV